MQQELVKLYNTLSLIETKGANTKAMADCLRFVEQLIQKQEESTEKETTEPVEVEEE